MIERRLAELARRHALDAAAVAPLSRLLDRLAEDATAPTAVREPDEAVDVHVADSLSGLAVPALGRARVVADLGSGAGFPVLVLAIARPETLFHAVESVSRKAAFIRAAADDLRVENVVVVPSRAEEWGEGLGRCDVVCARALAPLAIVCEYAAPLLADGGTLVAWKGALSHEESRDGAHAAAVLGLSAPEELEVRPYPSSERRRLVIARKVAATPSEYPRRAGMAVKRPLRA